MDLKIALGAAAMQRILQFDQAIDHRMLRLETRSLQSAGQQEHRTAGKPGLSLQFVDEFLRFEKRSRFFMHRDQAVENKNGGVAPADFAAHQIEQAAQAIILQGLERTDIRHPIGHRGLVEERHPPHMTDHPGVAFRQQRHVQRVVTLGGLREANLVAEDGLAGSGRALNKVDPALENTAAQYRIETRNARRETVARRGQIVHVASPPNYAGTDRAVA